MKEAKYFTIEELVPPDIYNTLGSEAWDLFNPKLIDTIDFIRESLNRPITANNYAWGGKHTLRGYRPKNCAIGAKRSAHKTGEAIDFDVQGMTADEVRAWLVNNKDRLPHPIRIEAVGCWVHVDVRAKKGYKLYAFKP